MQDNADKSFEDIPKLFNVTKKLNRRDLPRYSASFIKFRHVQKYKSFLKNTLEIYNTYEQVDNKMVQAYVTLYARQCKNSEFRIQMLINMAT